MSCRFSNSSSIYSFGDGYRRGVIYTVASKWNFLELWSSSCVTGNQGNYSCEIRREEGRKCLLIVFNPDNYYFTFSSLQMTNRNKLQIVE